MSNDLTIEQKSRWYTWTIHVSRLDDGSVQILRERDGEPQPDQTSIVHPKRLAVLAKFDADQPRQPGRIGIPKDDTDAHFIIGQLGAHNLMSSSGRGRGGWYKLTDLGAAVLKVAGPIEVPKEVPREPKPVRKPLREAPPVVFGIIALGILLAESNDEGDIMYHVYASREEAEKALANMRRVKGGFVQEITVR